MNHSRESQWDDYEHESLEPSDWRSRHDGKFRDKSSTAHQRRTRTNASHLYSPIFTNIVFHVMPQILPRNVLCGRRYSQLRRQHVPIVSFSSTSKLSAVDPAADLGDSVSPAKAPKPEVGPVPSRPAGEPSDSRNPFMQGYPDPRTGRLTTSIASPDTTTPERPSYNSSPYETPESNPAAHISRSLNPVTSGRGPKPAYQTRSRSRAQNTLKTISPYEQRSLEFQARTLEQHMSRVWHDGEVYSPHDLSWVEQQKAKQARLVGHRSQLNTLNSRRHGGKDVLDELGINPVHEYKNFTMLGEFVSEMGRIKHSRETGLRAVNQRKMAKAVRRAIGIGIFPSVHRHPELLPERRQQREGILSYNKT